MNEIGLYSKVIYLDYQPKNNEELASLITEHFNTICLPEDLENYERLSLYNQQIEDYELESRRQEYNLDI